MSLLSRLFRSKAQKAVDALQQGLDRRLLAVQAGLELFETATNAFEASNIPRGSPGSEAFKLGQGKHAYFTNALLDDLTHAEELIKAMHRALEYNGGRPMAGFEKEVIEAEKVLERTDANVNRLRNVCQGLLDIAGEVPSSRPGAWPSQNDRKM